MGALRVVAPLCAPRMMQELQRYLRLKTDAHRALNAELRVLTVLRQLCFCEISASTVACSHWRRVCLELYSVPCPWSKYMHEEAARFSAALLMTPAFSGLLQASPALLFETRIASKAPSRG